MAIVVEYSIPTISSYDNELYFQSIYVDLTDRQFSLNSDELRDLLLTMDSEVRKDFEENSTFLYDDTFKRCIQSLNTIDDNALPILDLGHVVMASVFVHVDGFSKQPLTVKKIDIRKL